VTDGDRSYHFECHGEEELYRARTLHQKEPGTLRWIGSELRPNDVFYDIGANIGLFTVYAACRLERPGVVYAFEPYVPSFSSLLRNIKLNGIGDRVHAMSCALHAKDGFFPFNYRVLTPGASDSQLGSTRTAKQKKFKPEAVELKQGVRVDVLLREGVIAPPNLVKIDVDGNELLILRGMEGLLRGRRAPRSIQVEVNPRYPELLDYLEGTGYQLAERHYTVYQQRRLDAGTLSPETAGYNGIFRKS
jgi:FkbM family methyltransferase